MGGCLLAGFAIGRFLHASPPGARANEHPFEGSTFEGPPSEAMVPRPDTTPVRTAPVRTVSTPPSTVSTPTVPNPVTPTDPTGSNGGGIR